MNKIYIFLIALSLNLIGFSQSADIPLTPANDPHWELKFEENFDIDAKGAKWDSVYGKFSPNKYWTRLHYNDHYGEPKIAIDTNVYAEDGYLVIKMENDSCQCPPEWNNNTNLDSNDLYWACRRQWTMYDSLGIDYYYKYSVGVVDTKRSAANQYGCFGYIEAKIKFPYHKSFWHAMWGYRMEQNMSKTLNEAEIDIELEGHLIKYPDGFIYPDTLNGATNYSVIPNTQNYVTNGIYRCYDNDYMNGELQGWQRYFKAIYVPNYSWDMEWHTYVIEWSLARIIWYIDNKPIRQLENHGIVDTLTLSFGLGFLNDFENDTSLANLTFPQKMYVDYVRVYGLKKECDSIFHAINYDFSNYDNTIKKKIIIGDGNSNETISTRTILRASESVEIKENFEVPLGVEFHIDVDGCKVEDIEYLMQYKCAGHGASMYE
ncbi:MAG: family 16 glycosylhydrolase [Bacteroidales bacterium]|jgi:beta-glucanase (GH16 family)|nr:family 16 glycosylhydrolase [Bacteroidales bacterium]